MEPTETTRLLGPCIIHLPPETKIPGFGELNKLKGLSLEELMPFQDDPWWQNLRKAFFLSFWITLIGIFIAACALSIIEHGHGTCPIRRIESNNIITSKTGVLPIHEIKFASSEVHNVDIIKDYKQELNNSVPAGKNIAS